MQKENEKINTSVNLTAVIKRSCYKDIIIENLDAVKVFTLNGACILERK